MGDAEMIHISGAMTAREMREFLTIMIVKESEGNLGIIAKRRELYRDTGAEGLTWLSTYQILGNYRMNST